MTVLLYPFFPLAAVAEPSVAEEDGHAHDHHHEEMDVIVVQATRSQRRVQDETIRVEVLSEEEIAEKLLMRPGNISMMLNETGGLRVQVTSPALGSANVRIHGMRGRYTQLLADGLPLYGGQASSLGLLQVPPSDLGQVEIIKGSSSALYGGQALGGVINLVSKRPGSQAEGEIILNATTRNAQDVSGYAAAPLGGDWSGSLMSNYNRQTAQDLDDDDWIDMPYYDRQSLRPRLFYDGPDGTRAYVTLGAMLEERRGGTVDGGTLPTGEPFPQLQNTERMDAGVVIDRPISNWGRAQFRASGMRQLHDHTFGELLEEDRHETMLIEASLAGDLRQSSSWIAGLAYQADAYVSNPFPGFDYRYKAPAAFGQIDHDLTDKLALTGSVRWDHHNEYGDQFSPRLSLIYRPGPWTLRTSWGRGFYAPTPFVEGTEAAGLSRLEPLSDLEAETAQTVSIDLGYAVGPFETGLTFFGSDIENAVRLEAVGPDRVRLINQQGTARTRGIEALASWKMKPWKVMTSYLFLDTEEPGAVGESRREVPLTPRHSAGVVAMWEDHDKGRVGLEVYYTGTQTLEDNPYRMRSEPYVHVGLLGEIVLGRYRLFLNLENLLNVRQSREDPMILPSRAPSGRWTVDAWAPLEGFIANAGLRIQFGG
ncbi:TonB-dependent receptor [Wenzhouxiangella sp. C33]|uniref:TonB-dependent receptor n=2 Tax=Wenzhouxiangella limi TaxID=2707351 RepID=A0A845UY55_9GAMM|nr:TonB-dependent receptor [Wenzhouxiangella limi]